MLGLQADQLIGERYRVVRFLAKGGMASVYEVEHRLTEKRLALKILHPHVLENRAARDSFEFEAKVAARVDSPHVVQVLDAGFEAQENEDVPYLVMELLRGETLEARVAREGPLSATIVLPWLRQIAEGLDAAHHHRGSKGEVQPIVHRDLKPDNVFLHDSPSGTMAKILDFGIAKLVTHSAQTSQTIRGTPLYISYEQLVGRQVSSATDIWSLGLIAFTLFLGKSYWLSASRSEARTESLFAEVVTLPLEPASIRARQLGLSGSVPAGFDEWFLRCIDRNPAARFSSAGEAVLQLQDVLSRGTFVVQPSERPEGEQEIERGGPLEIENTLPSSFPSSQMGAVSVPPGISPGPTQIRKDQPGKELEGRNAPEVVESSSQVGTAAVFADSHPALSSSRKPTGDALTKKPWLWISVAAAALLGLGVDGWGVRPSNVELDHEQEAELGGEVPVQNPGTPPSRGLGMEPALPEPSSVAPSDAKPPQLASPQPAGNQPVSPQPTSSHAQKGSPELPHAVPAVSQVSPASTPALRPAATTPAPTPLVTGQEPSSTSADSKPPASLPEATPPEKKVKVLDAYSTY